MDGFSSHTFKLVSHESKIHFAKFHIKTDQKIKNLTGEKAKELAGTDPDYATRDLFDAISKGNFPSWTVYIQLMTPDQAPKYRWNILDVTKVWPHKDFPLIPIGKLVLNKNPENYFAETEQAAFSPSHLAPGIEASFDKMLQGRLFSYPDTHRHRLGVNYKQIPINQSRNAPVANHQRDGFMTVNGNGGSLPNYEPSSFDKIKQAGIGLVGITYTPERVTGTVIKHPMQISDDDFVQAGALYNLQPEDAKARLVGNVAGHLANAKPHIRKRQLDNFRRANPEYGKRIEAGMAKSASRI
jgi:catalase